MGLLAFDFFFHVRKAHTPTLKEATLWSIIYVGLAVLFGIAVTIFGGVDMGTQYFNGWLLEKALSVDNLFVFLVIMGSFAVPRQDQQKVLLFGIVFALLARSVFIALGKAMLETWSWTFYIFGLILMITAAGCWPPTTASPGTPTTSSSGWRKNTCTPPTTTTGTSCPPWRTANGCSPRCCW